MTSPAPHDALQGTDFDELDQILDELAAQGGDVPPWEYLDGALAALVCTRRPVPPSEWLPVLLGTGPLPTAPHPEGVHFPSTARYERFLELCARREAELRTALSTEVQSLDDERSYHPEVVDLRGAIAAMPEAERPGGDEDEPLPSYAQAWAEGFCDVVEHWAEEWAAPRDKETAGWIEESLQSIALLTDDDRGQPSLNLHEEDAPPSVSDARLDQFYAAIWAVYELFKVWRALGPRTEPVRSAATPGRNDPCWCGSGKKFKKCHGA